MHLYVSFREAKDGFFLDLLEKVKENQEHHWLDLTLMTDANSNRSKIPEIVDGMLSKNIDKAWICGPSGFNRFFSNLLLERGMDRSKIIVM